MECGLIREQVASDLIKRYNRVIGSVWARLPYEFPWEEGQKRAVGALCSLEGSSQPEVWLGLVLVVESLIQEPNKIKEEILKTQLPRWD